jgi:hypothetical protein
MAEGHASHRRSPKRLGSVTTRSFLPQSVNSVQKVALSMALKLPSAHGSQSLSLELVGSTLAKEPGSH